MRVVETVSSFMVLLLCSSCGGHVSGAAFVPATTTTVWTVSTAQTTNNVIQSVPQRRAAATMGLSMGMSDTSATASTSAVKFLEELLPSLATGMGGQKLLDASSESWRKAIFAAVGAPDTANESIVAKALQDAMSKSNNQFAILMGQAEPFVATFPSDVVDYKGDGTAWVECRLRHATTDALLVTMGINVLQSETNPNQWFISSLDWQDFRDEFYPGLSGREWLRAF